MIVEAFKEERYNPNDYVIKQGEEGDKLYVVMQGNLECFKNEKN